MYYEIIFKFQQPTYSLFKWWWVEKNKDFISILQGSSTFQVSTDPLWITQKYCADLFFRHKSSRVYI